jgi:hypothetical protein
MIRDGEKLRDFLTRGGRLRRRFLAKAQKQARPLLEACTVDGRAPIDEDEIAAVLTVLRAELAARVAAHRWRQVGVAVDDGELQVRLACLADLYEELDVVAVIGTARDCVEDLLQQHGIDYRLFEAADWDSISGAARLAPLIARAKDAASWLANLQAEVERLRQVGNAPPELEQISQAIQTRDPSAYQGACWHSNRPASSSVSNNAAWSCRTGCGLPIHCCPSSSLAHQTTQRGTSV